MNEKDKWSVHVEYLKLAIALSTALIAAGAAIYTDAAKVPTDWSRFVFLAAAVTVFLTLLCSLLSTAALSNHMIHTAGSPPTPGSATAAQANLRARRVIVYANLSFLSLALSVAFLGGFFAIKTFEPDGTLFDRALSAAMAAGSRHINLTAGETLALGSFGRQGSDYIIAFKIIPTPESVWVQTDAQGKVIRSVRH